MLAEWQRALASLDAARVLQETGYPDFAASRAYYAAFYAASAVLLARGSDVTKHTAVLSAIHRDFVHRGELAREQGRALDWLFELRGIGDYGQSRHVSEDEAEKAIELARGFLRACAGVLGIVNGADGTP